MYWQQLYKWIISSRNKRYNYYKHNGTGARMLKNRSVASNFVKKTVQFLGFFLFRFPMRFKVLDLSVLCFLLNFIYDLTRKISVGLYIFICLNILSKMLNIKQYNNPNAAVGFYNELYTDDFISLCRTSQQ